MTTVRTGAIAMLTLGIVASLVGSPVLASTVYYTDFSDIATTGGFPDDWTTLDSYGAWAVDDVEDEFGLTAVSDDSMVAYGDAWTLTDYTVSATFHKAGGRAGIVGRLQDADHYYSLRVKDNNRFQLYWIGPNDTYGLVKQVNLDPTYVNDDSCVMSMAFDGSNITCEVRNSSDEVMGGFMVVDETYAGGTAGLRADHLTFGCEEFRIDAVPEPGAVVLLISALAGLLAVRRKR